jgi:hypothetical protein
MEAQKEIIRLKAVNTRLRSYLNEISKMVECFDGRRNKGKIRRAAAIAKQALEENAQ